MIGRLVSEGDAKNVSRQDAQFIYQEGETMRQRPGLTGTGPSDDPDEALCGGNSLPLGWIQLLKDVCHLGHLPVCDSFLL